MSRLSLASNIHAKLVLVEKYDGREMNERVLGIPVMSSNRSTGYRWTLAPASGGVLTALGEPVYKPAYTPTGGVGSGGVEAWSFVASQSGRQKLRFEYRRPWERGAAAARSEIPDKVRQHSFVASGVLRSEDRSAATRFKRIEAHLPTLQRC
jgi:predicted secreted protein